MAIKHKNLHITVATPEAKIFDTDIFDAMLPVHDGLVGIMINHAPMLCKLKAGQLRFHETGQPRATTVFLTGGVAHVCDNDIVVLAPKTIKRKDMTVEQAREKLREAEQMPEGTSEQVEEKTTALECARDLIKFIQQDIV